jgi:cytochrome P450
LKGQGITKPRFYQALERSKANIVTILDEKEHGFRQRLLGHGLTAPSLGKREARMLAHVDAFCSALSDTEEGTWGTARDMAEWCSYLTFDIMADIVFGAESGLLTDSVNRHLVRDIGQSARRAFCLIYTPVLFIGRMDKLLFPEAVRSRKRFLRFVDQLVEKKNMGKSKEGRGDIFTSLFSLSDTETHRTLDSGSILSEATALTVAGERTITFHRRINELLTECHCRIRHHSRRTLRPFLLSKPLPSRLREARPRDPHSMPFARRDPVGRNTK